MDKKEIDKLSAAYNNVPDKQIINELSWFNPYNSVTSAAKRWASGRGGFGSQLASKILDTEDADARGTAVNQALDLAKLQQNLLHGEELTAFIARSYELLGNE